MRIAVPLSKGSLAEHFGHCESFALMDVDSLSRSVRATTEVPAPDHEPGLLPRWLKQRGVTVVIASAMGSRARSLFEAASIEVLTGAPHGSAKSIAEMYLAGTLTLGSNNCDHH